MSTDGFGHFFMSDDEEPEQTPIAVPVDERVTSAPAAAAVAPPPMPVAPPVVVPAPSPVVPAQPVVAPPVEIAQAVRAAEVAAPGVMSPVAEPRQVQPEPVAERMVEPDTRERRLAEVLDRLMTDAPQIDAAALVSLDGFTMASALPDGMQEDRVGAMSAAILGLGERAAAELGKGKLSQVFIEGEQGYVMLIAAGDRAVLTCLAASDAKLGLVLYDMQDAADAIAAILS